MTCWVCSILVEGEAEKQNTDGRNVRHSRSHRASFHRSTINASIEQTPPPHPADLLALRTRNDLTVRSDELLVRLAKQEQRSAGLEQALAWATYTEGDDNDNLGGCGLN